ncbi:molybdopterin converting factor subunit 1 [Lutibacter sp.]|uniref:molybdopterin converting factor subunit 1 n=1 Tax=Lutibacter sp. TaxID=1925666 RepID=UPI002736767D|nr:molybdopterin converting factor subunit 1 [Lutibacter sp.]MDP3314021.1 molybdopterin converting factor subunit 1 [Lutibacter sp.]
MKISILFFGITTDLVGSNSQLFSLEENATVEHLKNELVKQYPNLKNINDYAIAVNEEYASSSLKLREGDVVAIIPPVSGG